MDDGKNVFKEVEEEEEELTTEEQLKLIDERMKQLEKLEKKLNVKPWYKSDGMQMVANIFVSSLTTALLNYAFNDEIDNMPETLTEKKLMLALKEERLKKKIVKLHQKQGLHP